MGLPIGAEGAVFAGVHRQLQELVRLGRPRHQHLGRIAAASARGLLVTLLIASTATALAPVGPAAAQLPTASTNSSFEAEESLAGVTSISAGYEHTCAVVTAGQAYCWGDNSVGQLGDGTTTERLTPVAVALTGIISISAGYEHTCAVVAAGQAYCWGANRFGELGDGTTTHRVTPVAVALTGVISISAADGATCAVVTSGQAFCWGYNGIGQIGDGTTTHRLTPVAVPLTGVISISASGGSSCAVITDGQAYCWGNYFRQPDGTGTGHLTPVAVPLSDVTSISAGDEHTCAIVGGGQAYCWGRNDYGQLGDGTTTHRPAPTAVPLSGVTSIGLGQHHSCAITASGQVYCWGYGGAGQLGDGSRATSGTPVAVALGGASVISAGSAHTCAKVTGAQAYCWGWNQHGQLGNGTTAYQLTPRLVRSSGGSPPPPPEGPSGESNPGDLNGDGRARWAVLGDSYISGEGLTQPATNGLGQAVARYDNGTDVRNNGCRRASTSWAVRLANAFGSLNSDLLFAACSGAETPHVTNQGQYRFSPHGIHGGLPQAELLKDIAREGPVDVVVLSIGGNDVRFGHWVTECVVEEPCDPTTEPRLGEVRGLVRDTLRVVGRAAPGAKVIVAGYPFVADPLDNACGKLAGISRIERQRFRTFVTRLNTEVHLAARDAGAAFLDLQHAFANQGICSDSGFVHGVTFGNDPVFHVNPVKELITRAVANESFHPTDEGHTRIASAYRNQVLELLAAQNPVAQMPDPGGPVWIDPRSRLAQWYFADPDRPGTVIQYYPARRELVQTGTFSIPTIIDEFEADPDKLNEISFRLSNTLAPGWHDLQVRSKATGELRASMPFFVQDTSGCANTAGPGDVDGDAWPDECDDDPLDGPLADYDGDGTPNGEDNCIAGANAGQADADGDGEGDACDPDQGGSAFAGGRNLLTDTSPPIVTASMASPNANGWHSRDVTITWSARDPDPSGGPASMPAPSVVSIEGSTIVIRSDPSCDAAGNCATGSATVNLDKTPPAIAATRPTGSSAFTFECSDALSGIERCGDRVDVPEPGMVGYRAVDRAGNEALVRVAEESGPDADPGKPTCGGFRATITGAGLIVGTPGPDVIVGSSGLDMILGLGGDDVICGRGGNDVIDGGGGNDVIHGEDGDDVIVGSSGQDSIDGGVGQNRCFVAPTATTLNCIREPLPRTSRPLVEQINSWFRRT
jgi:alpha-tubulin suppressor-like RCC1 family protein/lysophospholipase L1-like esterase